MTAMLHRLGLVSLEARLGIVALLEGARLRFAGLRLAVVHAVFRL